MWKKLDRVAVISLLLITLSLTILGLVRVHEMNGTKQEQVMMNKV